jgi:hypothetical protein
VSTSPTTMRTGHILGSGRKRRLAGFGARHPAASLLIHDSAVCIIATIGLHDPEPQVGKNQTLDAILYICAACARVPSARTRARASKGLPGAPGHLPSTLVTRIAWLLRSGSGFGEQHRTGQRCCHYNRSLARPDGTPGANGVRRAELIQQDRSTIPGVLHLQLSEVKIQ